jgi:UDP-apiose/xylose synthase
MAALINRRPMYLVDGGRARRTIMSIEDAMDVIMKVIELPEASKNEIFNIGNPANEVTIRELAELMRQLYASITGDNSYLSHPIEDISSEDFYGRGYEDCDRRMPNIQRASEKLGWKPTKSLEETLLETMLTYHESYAV